MNNITLETLKKSKNEIIMLSHINNEINIYLWVERILWNNNIVLGFNVVNNYYYTKNKISWKWKIRTFVNQNIVTYIWFMAEIGLIEGKYWNHS